MQFNYPNGINPTIVNQTNPIQSNKGLDFEYLIDVSNTYYASRQLAWITKFPTPIQVVKTKNNIITQAYFKTPSACDYIGYNKQHTFVFEAKSTSHPTYFYLNQIANHQLHHLMDAQSYNVISFILVYFKKYQLTYYLPTSYLVDSIQKGIKSIKIDKFNQNNWLIPSNGYLCPIDYLQKIKEDLNE